MRIIIIFFFWRVRNNNVIPCWSLGKFLSFIHRRSHARDREVSPEQVESLRIYLRTLKSTCSFKTPSNSRTSSTLCAAGNRLCDQAGRHDIYPPFACKRLWNWHDNKLLALPDCIEDRLAVTFDRRARPQSHAWETFLWDTSSPINSSFIHIFSKPFQMIDCSKVCTSFWGRKSAIKGAKKVILCHLHIINYASPNMQTQWTCSCTYFSLFQIFTNHLRLN